MRKKTSRFISVFMAVILVFSLVPSALASTGVDYKQKPDFWQWIAGKGSILHNLVGYTVGAVCPHSEDGYHHASNYDRLDTFFGGETGYYDCTCDYCGATFKAYESDLQQSYDAQVAELPAQGVTASGSLLWRPFSTSNFTAYGRSNNSGSFVAVPFSWSDTIGDSRVSHLFTCKFEFDSRSNCVVGLASVDTETTHSLFLKYDIVAPVSGLYHRVPSLFSTFVSYSDKGVIRNGDPSFYSETSFYRLSGGTRSFGGSNDLSVYVTGSQVAVAYFYGPEFVILPDSDLMGFGDTYNIQSRPTSITGDYGIIGDNGQIIKVAGDYIVNETTNTYQNPATGTTTPIVDWSYDYGDRAYTLSLEGGLSASVKYGDDNITINESTVNDTGDTITNNYTIYYLVDGSGTEDPDPSPSPSDPPVCAHTWTETSRTEPTCTTAGKVMSTCSKCNQTKTETIPATGHTWVVERTVQTSYDEEGNLLQQGYTIYKCSVCGEEYKDMEGTGPPGEEEKKSIWEKLGDLIGSIFGGIGELIEAILGKLLDALQSLADMLMDKLKSVVETVLSIFDELPALFGGFLDFLGAIFPYLPPEITMLLTFGVVAVVFIGILKAVRR